MMFINKKSRDNSRKSWATSGRIHLEALESRNLLSLSPAVLSVTPADGSMGVTSGANLTATFNEALDPDSVGASNFILRDQANKTIPCSIKYDSSSNSAVIIPSVALAGGDAFTATIRGGTGGVKDVAGVPLANDFTWSFTAMDQSMGMTSLWNNGTPNVRDNGNVNKSVVAGVKFRSDSGGYINSIRVYKGGWQADTYTGQLWSASGTLLASTQSYAAPQGTGWQTLYFDKPIPIAAGATYVAAYNGQNGRFYDSPLGLVNGRDSGPLHVPINGGVYKWGPGFPTSPAASSPWASSSFMVDVNFVGTDTPGINIDRTTGLVTTGAGGTASFSVNLNSMPSDSVTIGLRSSNPGEGSLSTTSLTFTRDNWNMPQTVGIRGVFDAAAGSDIAYSIITAPAVSADPSYIGLDGPDVQVVNAFTGTRPALENAAQAEAQRFAYAEEHGQPLIQGDMAMMDDPGMAQEYKSLIGLVPVSSATNMAVTSGDWSDPNTWSDRRVPASGANVWIMPGRTVNVDGTIAPALHTIRVSGVLNFDADRDTKVTVDTIVVDPLGRLIMGTMTDPIAAGKTAIVVFSDTGPIDRNWDPMGLSRGLIIHGSASIVGAQVSGHAQLAATPKAGESTLVLTAAPIGWKAGDVVGLPGSASRLDEQFRITAVSADGKTLSLDHAVGYSRLAPSQAGEALYVANLTRNIVFMSQNVQNITCRGHVMFMHTDDAMVAYAAFNGLGRTDFSQPINNAVLDAGGHLVPGTGTNPKGRYALHFHIAGADASMMPALVQGCVVNDSGGWGFDNHSSNVDFEDNVSYNAREAGFVTEAGDEVGTFNNNMAIRGGQGFWLNGVGVSVTNNIATGFTDTYRNGIIISNYVNTRGGRPIYFSASNLGLSGAVDPSAPSDYVKITKVSINLYNNQIYNCFGGISVKGHEGSFDPNLRSTISGGTIWDVRVGINFDYAQSVTLKDIRLYSTDLLDTAAYHGDASPNDLIFDHLTVVGWGYGIVVPYTGNTKIVGGYYNNLYNIEIPAELVPGPALIRRTVTVSGVQFGTIDPAILAKRTTRNQQYDFYLEDTPVTDGQLWKRFLEEQILYDGKQIYLPDQAANYVIQGTNSPALDGKTNAEIWSLYHLALHGAVSPADATTTPRIFGGLIGSVTSVPSTTMELNSAVFTNRLSGYVPAIFNGVYGRWLAGSPVNLNEGWNLVPFTVDGGTRYVMVFGDTTPPTFAIAPDLQGLTIRSADLAKGYTVRGTIRDASYGTDGLNFSKTFGNLTQLVRPDHTIPLNFDVTDRAGNVGHISLILKVDSPVSVAYVGADTATQGNWKGTYGGSGFNVVADAAGYPSYAQVTPSGQSSYTWAATTSDARALQRGGPGETGRVAATWFGGLFTVDLNLTDGQAHRVSLYAVDWDSTARQERVDVVDPASGAVLDSRAIASFHGGAYLTWNLSGHVQLRITRLAGANAVLSGLFFDEQVQALRAPRMQAAFQDAVPVLKAEVSSQAIREGSVAALEPPMAPVSTNPGLVYSMATTKAAIEGVRTPFLPRGPRAQLTQGRHLHGGAPSHSRSGHGLVTPPGGGHRRPSHGNSRTGHTPVKGAGHRSSTKLIRRPRGH